MLKRIYMRSNTIRRGAVALALLVSFNGVAADSRLVADKPVECDFDQAYLAQRLQQAASRHGGAKLDAIEKTATWTLANGETVQLAYGGCIDLGTRVRLIHAKGRPAPTREIAVKRLIDTVARYWTAADARRIEVAYRRGHLQEREIRSGVTEISGPLDADGFSFEFRIEQSDGEISVSWQDA